MAKANLELYKNDRQSIQYELWPTYGSTTNCTKPPQILWSQGGALGSMGHVAEKRQWAKNLNGKDGGGKGLG